MNHNGMVLVLSSETGEILNQAEMGGLMMIIPVHLLLSPGQICLLGPTKIYIALNNK